MKRTAVAGFSLPELLTVMTILGILALLAKPAIDRLRLSGDSAMLQVGTVLQSAQRQAVSRQYDVLVTFDPVAGSVRLVDDVNGNGLAEIGERARGVGLDKEIVYGRGTAPARSFGAGPISLANGATTVVFHRNGSASTSGGLYLTSVASAAGDLKRAKDTRAIEIVRATGRIEWWRYNGSQWVRGF